MVLVKEVVFEVIAIPAGELIESRLGLPTGIGGGVLKYV
jgi:hypothetical protein